MVSSLRLVLLIGLVGLNGMLLLCISASEAASVYLIEGLLLDLAGASLMIFPDVDWVSERLERPETRDRINLITEAQDRLFLGTPLGEISRKDTGFSELHEAISQTVQFVIEPDRMTAGSGGFGGSARLHYVFETWGKTTQMGIAPTAVVDSRVTDHISKLENEVTERVSQWGLELLGLGFSLQLLSALIKNWRILTQLAPL